MYAGRSGPDTVGSLTLTISVVYFLSSNLPPFPPVIHKEPSGRLIP